jgi:hypothetical protein
MSLKVQIIEAGTQVGVKFGNEVSFYERVDIEVFSTDDSLVGLYVKETDEEIVLAPTTDWINPKEASVKDLIEKIKDILITIPVLELTLEELEAIQGANNPSSSNVFVTFLDMIASLVGFTPNGSITSTNVQDAIVEVRDEAVALEGKVKISGSDTTSSFLVAKLNSITGDILFSVNNIGFNEVLTLTVSSKFFNKNVDSSDDITEGIVNLFMTVAERINLSNQSGINTGDEVQATETTLGVAEIATQAETDAGVDDTTIITPLKLKNTPAVGGEKSMVVSFASGSTKHVTTNSNTYASLAHFIYAGSSVVGDINNFNVNIWKVGIGTNGVDVRLVDLSTGLVIAELLNVTSLLESNIQDMGAISNLPTNSSVIEVQGKRNGGVTLYIGSLELQY